VTEIKIKDAKNNGESSTATYNAIPTENHLTLHCQWEEICVQFFQCANVTSRSITVMLYLFNSWQT